MKFSITQMLYGMVVFALVAAIIGAGTSGSPLAYGIGVSLVLVAVYFFFFAILYWFTLLIPIGKKASPVSTENDSIEESE